MNFNDFTIQWNMIFHYFHDLVRYQFWHWLFDDFGHRFWVHVGTPLVSNAMFLGDLFLDEFLNRFFVDLRPKRCPPKCRAMATASIQGPRDRHFNGQIVVVLAPCCIREKSFGLMKRCDLDVPKIFWLEMTNINKPWKECILYRLYDGLCSYWRDVDVWQRCCNNITVLRAEVQV